MPDVERPHGGDVDAAVQALVPFAEIVCEMPDAGNKEGTEEWCLNMLKNDTWTLQHAVTYQPIMDRFISLLAAKGIKTGHNRGFPIVVGNNVPFTDPYTVNPKCLPSYMPGSVAGHKDLPPLRHQNVVACQLDLKNRCLYPQAVKAKDMPTKVPWNNFVQVCIVIISF